MDKLKTKVLFISLIILALLSIGAVAAADDASDEIISEPQDDFDLSEETVSDVQSAQETEVLTDDEPAQNPDGSSYITVKFSYITEDGPVEVVNQSLSKKVAANRNLTISYSNLLNNKPPANRFKYDGLNYNFTSYWKNSVTGEIFKQGRGCDQVFLPTGYNYTVVLTAQYETYEDTFVNISYIVKDSSGDDVNITETYNIPYPGSFYEVFVSKNNFTNLNKTYKGYTLDGYEYYLDHWEDGDGNVVDSTKSYNHGYTGENYTVTYKAIYKAKGNPSNITVKVVGLKDVNGNDVNSELTNKIDPGVTWIIHYAMFEDEIDRYKTYDANGIHYTFKHLLDPEGVPITDPESYERTLKPNGTDYTVLYTVVYDEEVIGNFTLIYNDALGHGSGSWNSTNNYGVDFTHTFKLPADIPSGAKFLYWERNDTNERFNVGDEYHIDYSEFAGKTVVVYVNAVYDIVTSIEIEEITDYVEEVIDITANIKSEVFKVDDPNGGTATLTIVYGDGNTYTQTVDVENGKAVFKDVKLENPGDFTYKVEYSGFSYNKHNEGINDYLPSSAESKLHVLALNTTVSNESATGKPGENVHVEFTVTDQNNHPVANGTLTVIVDGTTYTDEVKEGKVAFDIVLPNPGNYSYDVNYEGNDYYNPSVGQLNLTVQKVDVIVTLPEVINYTGAVVDIVVDVIDEYGNPVNEGTVNLVIDFGTKLSNKLMATALSNTAEVSNGKAVFKDITLGEPGKYPSYAQYSGSDYYNEAENTSDVIVLPLNTTTESQDVSGHSGDKKDITADIVDQNGNPVKNGTAVLKVNGKEYTAEVKDGKAIFKDVELPSESTDATIDYLGNEYYNPSSTTIKITISEDEEQEGGDEPINGTEDKTSTANAVKAVSVLPSTGNPIALVILALLTLVSTVSLGRKK